MKNDLPYEDILEPERYELHSGPAYRFDIDRRDFFKALGAGLAVVVALPSVGKGQESGGGRGRPRPNAPQEIGAWIHISDEGGVKVFTGKTEVGQDIRTSLAQAVADELSMPITAVKLTMADTDLTPFDMGTFGSLSTPQMAPQLRRAAAAAREVLLDLGAENLNTDRSSLSISNGKIVDAKSKRAVAIGVLTRGQKIMKTIPGELKPAQVSNWKIAGKPEVRVNGIELVTGRHRYPSDIKRPGMLYGSLLRPPKYGATLASCDVKEAEGPGITVVRDNEFVGVVAPGADLSRQALRRIKATWNEVAQPGEKDLPAVLTKETGQRGSRFALGNVSDARAAADIKLEATFSVAYIAHAPLEPRAAVAEWEGEKLTVWTGTQRPFGVRSELAQALRIPEDKVRVIVPDTGSGYGGKHTGECAVEAARLAKAAGKPVKLVWSREEEFIWAYFRPAGIIEVQAGVARDGNLKYWEFHNYNSGASSIRTLYDVPNQIIEFHPSQSPLKQGSYRGLAATANHFARESHMDDMARAVKMDPLEFRLRNLKDPRLRAVLQAAAEKSGWGKQAQGSTEGFGIAGGFEKGSYVATCAQVAIDGKTGSVKVVRAVTAFECGAVVNPHGLKNQIEGSVVQGIGGALFEAIHFEDGKILNPRFSSYRVPRFQRSAEA